MGACGSKRWLWRRCQVCVRRLGAGQPVSLTAAEEEEEDEEEGGASAVARCANASFSKSDAETQRRTGASSCQRMQEASKGRHHCAAARSLVML